MDGAVFARWRPKMGGHLAGRGNRNLLPRLLRRQGEGQQEEKRNYAVCIHRAIDPCGKERRAALPRCKDCSLRVIVPGITHRDRRADLSARDHHRITLDLRFGGHELLVGAGDREPFQRPVFGLEAASQVRELQSNRIAGPAFIDWYTGPEYSSLRP